MSLSGSFPPLDKLPLSPNCFHEQIDTDEKAIANRSNYAELPFNSFTFAFLGWLPPTSSKKLESNATLRTSLLVYWRHSFSNSMNSMLLSCQQCRQFDQIAIEEFGVPGIVLMENAGKECAREIFSRYGKRQCVILCGPGNNGGDGFVVARHMNLLGTPVAVLVVSDVNRMSEDARVNFEILRKTEVSICVLETSWVAEQFQAFYRQYDEEIVIIDALLGTGAAGGLREPFRSAVLCANQALGAKVAIDVPTGLLGIQSPDSIVFQSDLTLTFVARKTCFENLAESNYLGDVQVINIGAPNEVFQRLLQS